MPDAQLAAFRALARDDPRVFFHYVTGWSPSPMQRQVLDGLGWLERTPGARLMLWGHPGSGKSVGVSVGVLWLLCRQAAGLGPLDNAIFASYSATPAEKFSGYTRNLLIDEQGRVRDVFPEALLDRESAARFSWRLKGYKGEDPSCMGVGIAGSLTSFHTPLLVVDDPYKGQSDADNPLVRQKVWEWHTGVALGRLRPDAAGGEARLMVIHTRFNADDFSAELLRREGREEDGGRWRVVHLPALTEAGESTWPERYPARYFEGIRNTAPLEFQAQYQGAPTTAVGDIWRRQWFDDNAYDAPSAVPPLTACWTAWDTATGQGKAGSDERAYTGWLRFGVDALGRFWVLDLGRGRPDFLELCELIRVGCGGGRGEVAVIEDASSGRQALQTLKSQARRPVQAAGAVGDKASRARSVLPVVAAGGVKFPRWHALYETFVAECTAFPKGRFKDMHDAFVHGVRYGLDHLGSDPAVGADTTGVLLGHGGGGLF